MNEAIIAVGLATTICLATFLINLIEREVRPFSTYLAWTLVGATCIFLGFEVGAILTNS